MRSRDSLRRSVAARRQNGPIGRFAGLLGPGLITGAADDDPAGIVTSLQAGAQFQYGLAWTTLVQLPLLAALQLMTARIGLVTGRDLPRILRDHYPRGVLAGACALLFVANTVTAAADIGGVSAGVELLTGLPRRLVVAPVAIAIVALLVWGSYERLAAALKWLTIALFAYVVAGALAAPDWGDVVRRTLIPHVEWNRDYLTMMVAVLGGTISPYMLVWQSAEEVEELRDTHKEPLKARPWAARRELNAMRRDTLVGMTASQIITWFIFVAGGAVIFTSGVRQLDTARQAALALQPIGRGLGEVLFAAGLIGTGLIAVPTLSGASAYALTAIAGLPSGIGRPVRAAKAFNVLLAGGTLVAAAIALFAANPMRLLVVSQVLNGLLAPPLLVLLLVVSNNKRLLGAHRNGWIGNSLGIAATLLMSVAAGALMYSWLANMS